MSIAQQIAAETASPLCKFGKVLAELNDADRDAVLTGLETGVTNVAVARILTANGHNIGEKAIRTHRNGIDCRCEGDS